jgi:hypothetical protein
VAGLSCGPRQSAASPWWNRSRSSRRVHTQKASSLRSEWVLIPPFALRNEQPEGRLRPVRLKGSPMVGVAGFEPTASSSRTKRATRLRHTPNDSVKKSPLPGKRGGFLPDFPRPCKRIFGKPKDHGIRRFPTARGNSGDPDGPASKGALSTCPWKPCLTWLPTSAGEARRSWRARGRGPWRCGGLP